MHLILDEIEQRDKLQAVVTALENVMFNHKNHSRLEARQCIVQGLQDFIE